MIYHDIPWAPGNVTTSSFPSPGSCDATVGDSVKIDGLEGKIKKVQRWWNIKKNAKAHYSICRWTIHPKGLSLPCRVVYWSCCEKLLQAIISYIITLDNYVYNFCSVSLIVTVIYYNHILQYSRFHNILMYYNIVGMLVDPMIPI